jgi:hypothetical protein
MRLSALVQKIRAPTDQRLQQAWYKHLINQVRSHLAIVDETLDSVCNYHIPVSLLQRASETWFRTLARCAEEMDVEVID